MASSLLSAQHLSKSYGAVSVLKDTSFDVPEGEILVLLGASGCGKSTTLRLLAGLERADTGRVAIRDRTVADVERGIFLPPERRNMGMVFQSFAVWPHMTVEEHVAFPLIARRADKKSAKARVDRTLDFVGLASFRSRRATELSGGQQQRLSLARALVYEPDILLLDEPLSNLDAKLRQQMRVELKRLQQQLGSTFVLVTHDRVEAMTLADRIAVMRDGAIEQIGQPDALYERPNSPFVHGFLGAIIDFNGEWVADGETPYVALSDGHRFQPSPDQIPAANGASRAVRVTIRTTDLEIVSEERAARINDLHATVASVIDLGNKYEVALHCDGNDFLLEMPKSLSVKSQQRLLLRVAPANVKTWHA